MRIRTLLSAVYLPLLVASQSETSQPGTQTTGASSSATGPAIGDVAQTTNLTYISYTSTITLSSTGASSTGNATANQTELIGTTSTTNGTASGTSSSARPTNTQPCNGYVEFCDRSYSNITYVAAHNFPFIKKNNAARNQDYGIIDQLNDGIRMLQAQAHWENETMYYCHTSCDLLNAGTVQAQFEKLVTWLEQNPFEVVTILMGNYDLTDVTNFVPAIQNSGLEKYLYTPPQIPMGINDWPTTSELIINQKRVIFFMDYQANQTVVPYILDEFSQMWETPFSPTNPDFPCTVNRPPNLNRNQSLERMYLANHNLNVDISDLGINILVPNVAAINQTNAVSGNSSLGLAAETCTSDWGRPPNFLLVDFYDKGNFPGSVFQVAATMNNVTYKGKCCGGSTSGALGRAFSSLHLVFSVGIVILCLCL
ncbi:uncharacterized protein PV09_03690 [Verruconis gallopava]|uniref:PLC-like phosphodiesterase n=1 Tax=Verruconis gallopava TaxID=253628 RepID=A0A0D2B1D9_9PEZI|nr:uncharacterized protein PV09_03690 [Verruconis gallopava]KIW05139.1 hypothetical protein PV09_03690 [Verruconis gallopava]